MKIERSNHRRARFAGLLAVVALGGISLGACGDDDDTPASTGSTTTAAAAEGDIVEVATEAGSFSVLLAAATSAGLVDELQGDGPLTVFAPTDEAFAAALEELGLTQEELLADTDTLNSILLYHVVEGEVPASDVLELDGEDVETLNGETVSVSVMGSDVMLNDTVTVIATDVAASNGLIHVIDGVLLPPSS